MNTTLDVINRIKSVHHVNSDYAVAKLLGVTRQAISKYRNKGQQFDDSVAFRAAKLVKMNPARLVTILHKERAANDDELNAWNEIESKCNLALDLKKQEVIETFDAAIKGKLNAKQKRKLRSIAEQCILCKID